MKITTHMTFFNSIRLRYRFNYINRIIKEICNYPYETDLYIHTNEIFSRKFLIENKKGKIEIIHHDFSNKEHDPYYLAWSCRSLLKQQKDDYDIFIYIEDDMMIPRESLNYWLQHKDTVIENKYNLGFGNWEKIKKFELLPKEFSIDAGEMTPKLSLKRKVILQKHETLILKIYDYKNTSL